jgi:phosphate uptake regulator
MGRKLVQHGPTTLMISLPRKWIKENGLAKGNILDITEEDNNVILSIGEKEKKLKKAEIDIKDIQEFNTYRSLIGGYYRAGYNQLTIRFNNSKILALLQQLIPTLYGFEITKFDKTHCIIKSIEKSGEIYFESLKNKTINIIKTIQSVIMEDIETNNFDSKDEIHIFRNSVLKIRDQIIREIAQNNRTSNNALPYYQIAISLWNIARNYFLMYLQFEKEKLLPETVRYLKDTNSFLIEHYSTFKKHDIQDTYKRYKKLREKGFGLIKDKNSSIIAICINILMAMQSMDSSILILNEEKKNT